MYRHNLWGLKDFSLETGPGIIGLLGPNGAGKSTLLRILATVTKPTEGQVYWDDVEITKSPDFLRERLGFLPQDFGIYPNLNAVEFLRYLAAARGITGRKAQTRIDQLLELVNLGDVRSRRLDSLSGGMKQRVGIAQALLNDPELLIVDEPTAGLDPEERIRFRNLLTDLSSERIVVLSSHIVSDIEAAASSIAIMNKGQLLSYSSPDELLSIVTGKTWELIIDNDQLQRFKQDCNITSTVRTREGVKIKVVGDVRPSSEAQTTTPTLEDAYLYVLDLDRRNAVPA